MPGCLLSTIFYLLRVTQKNMNSVQFSCVVYIYVHMTSALDIFIHIVRSLAVCISVQTVYFISISNCQDSLHIATLCIVRALCICIARCNCISILDLKCVFVFMICYESKASGAARTLDSASSRRDSL